VISELRDKEFVQKPMSNKIYKVVSFHVPSDHIQMVEEWHFEKPQPDQLTRQMEVSLNQLAEDGWRVVGSETLLAGEYRLPLGPGQGELSLGYSVTRSLVVILEKDKPDQ
jgi:hypothetical protein